MKGRYRTLNDAVGVIYPFLDTDLYKWLEAAAWELGRRQDRTLAKQADEAIELVANAQRDDGYLNTYVQVLVPGGEYRDLAWGHELYCFGHLIQAAIAWRRALGDDRLLRVAEGMVDSLERQVEATGHIVLDGHPEIEMALVELYRTTGDRRHLDLAARMVEGRGEGRIGIGRFGSAYWQDHARVRDAATVAGHAVRQLYLDCGAVDVAVELGDRELLDAVIRRWRDMVATRMYLTGGLGSRHLDEAFGDPFELPPDRAYAETCAAIASVMLAWRLLLATGDPDFADVIERTIYNGVLPGVSHDGRSFFYVNTLQRRTDRAAEPPGRGERAAWYPCACCPAERDAPARVPGRNTSRPTDPDGIQIHQYATAEVRGSVAGGIVRVATKTRVPVGWHPQRDGAGDAGAAMDADRPHPRLVDLGHPPKHGRPAGPGRVRPPPGQRDEDVASGRFHRRHARHAGPGDPAGRPARRGEGLRRARARAARLLHRERGPPAGRPPGGGRTRVGRPAGRRPATGSRRRRDRDRRAGRPASPGR